MIIILDDGREDNSPNILFRNTKSERIKKLYNMPWDDLLQNGIGVIFVRVEQITGRHFDQTAGIGFSFVKEAYPQEQTIEMTNKIMALINHPQNE